MTDRFKYLLLIAAALLGVALAVWQSGEINAGGSTEAVAIVNGVPIGGAALEQALQAVQHDHDVGVISGEERRRVLDRLIDEELLLQRAESLQLLRRDPVLKGQIIASVIADIVADAGAPEPTAAELNRYIDTNRSTLRGSDRFAFDVLHFDGKDAMARANRAANGEFDNVHADPNPLPLPRTPTSLSTWRNYLGSEIVDAIDQLEPGEIAGPIKVNDAFVVVRVRSRSLSHSETTFDEEVVSRAYQRERDEATLRGFFERARRNSTIEYLDRQ
ncbi:MAG: peptidyl-prolyl cis-trans isomerase [Polyangiales bacterium]